MATGTMTLPTANWDNIKITPSLYKNPALTAISLLEKVFPEHKFGYATDNEMMEWTTKHWYILTSGDWPNFEKDWKEGNRLSREFGGLRVDVEGCFRNGHNYVMYRRRDFDEKFRKMEREAMQERFNRMTGVGEEVQHDGKVAPSVTESEHKVQRGRKPKREE